jgi:ABC-type transport system substrate-binding protein
MYTLILPQFEEFAHPDIRPGGALENLTYPYNLTEAAHILDEAGFIDIDGDGWRNFPEELGGDGSNIILKYFIRSDDLKRKALGLWHANQLE